MAAMAGAKARTAVLVNLAMVVEQANEQVLPAVYLFVGRSLNATPVQLGTLTLCRAMVQTLASPLSGILGDRYDRVLVLSSGAFIWGIMTSAMALTVTLHQAMTFAALNGLGLALLVPCCQSLIADLYPAEQRGRAFGTLQLTASLGGMLGGVFATNMGGMRLAGMDGWRAAFHTVAAISLLVGACALMMAVDPRRMRYQLLRSNTEITTNLLLAPPDQPSPQGSSCSAGSDEPSAAISSTGAITPGAGGSSLLDRRRAGGAAGAGGVHAGAGAGTGAGHVVLSTGGGSSTKVEKRSSSWHVLDYDTAGGHHEDTMPSPDSSTALLYRPHHAAVAVTGGKGRGHGPGEQLMLHTQNYEPSHHHHHHHRDHHHPHHQQQQALHSQLQQRLITSPSPSGEALNSSPQQQQQQHHWGSCSDTGPGSVPDSPRKQLDVSGKGKFKRRGVVADVCWMLKIKTFQAIVLQGIVGCFPWQAMVFFTLWLQLTGFSNSTASLLVATFGAGVAVGALLGGAVGDRMAQRLPNSGRIFTAQFSVFCGIPLTWMLLKGLPASPFSLEPAAYGCLMFLMGLTCTWAGAGCNSPIFAEIVPDELRSTIYAFDRSFENSIAACAAPAVGLLAERVFGFTGVLNDDTMRDKELRMRNAAALGSSLLACMTVPWSLCLLFYTALHWFYPKDKAMARTWASSGDSTAVFHH